jgi:riboflavin synthase
MFTGIIETIGSVREWVSRGDGARAHIEAAPIIPELRVGDSIAVDGACLTVTGLRGDLFGCDLSAETLARTTLGRLRGGSRVNLERPLRLSDRLGGHLVTGHVDVIGEIADRVPQGDGEVIRIRFPTILAPLLVMKGSIAVDGISLTVAELTGERFGVAAIPYTLQHTTLGGKRVGEPVNLEADLLGKHLARLLAARSASLGAGGVTLALLQEHGFA